MAAVASSEVEEVEEGTYCCVREAHNVIHQAGIGSLRKLPQMVHRTLGWGSPKTERIPIVLTKTEGVPTYHPVHGRGRDGDLG